MRSLPGVNVVYRGRLSLLHGVRRRGVLQLFIVDMLCVPVQLDLERRDRRKLACVVQLHKRLYCVRVGQFTVVLVPGWLVDERRDVRSLPTRVILGLGLLADVLSVPSRYLRRVTGRIVVHALPNGQLVIERVGLLLCVRSVILLFSFGVGLSQVP